jgi:hypothetical protein
VGFKDLARRRCEGVPKFDRAFQEQSNFARYPLASDHHSEGIERRCHTKFIVLPFRIDPKISQCVANDRSVSFNHKGEMRRLVVNLEIPSGVLKAGRNGWRVQSDVDQRTGVFRLVRSPKGNPKQLSPVMRAAASRSIANVAYGIKSVAI